MNAVVWVDGNGNLNIELEEGGGFILRQDDLELLESLSDDPWDYETDGDGD